jgi:sigma-E factor negative regulatory protein RseC
MNQECKSRGISYTAANPRKLPLSVGQTVETETPALLKQALGVLLPPVLGFIAGYFFMRLCFPALGDPARAVAGLFLMFLAAAARFLIRNRFSRAGLPQVKRIIKS